MSQIRPIETEYNGYRFRSRLEARWAVFFDALGVSYEYEPEGFALPSGKQYLPDFRVKCYGTRGKRDGVPFDLYVEVKGRMTDEDAARIKEFANTECINYDYGRNGETHPTLVVGNIPEDGCLAGDPYDRMDGVNIYPFNCETIDGDNFAAYPAAHGGHFYLMGGDSNYINGDDCAAVLNAYKMARQARFEHGETPTKESVQGR